VRAQEEVKARDNPSREKKKKGMTQARKEKKEAVG